jgi:hypothetical protein
MVEVRWRADKPRAEAAPSLEFTEAAQSLVFLVTVSQSRTTPAPGVKREMR